MAIAAVIYVLNEIWRRIPADWQAGLILIGCALAAILVWNLLWQLFLRWLQGGPKRQAPKYAKVAIISLTTLVVVEPGLIARLRAGQIPSSQELVMHSVEIWDNRFQALAPEQIGDELYALRRGQHDNFLGYMRGLLQELG
jgi:hypothetical protein